MHCNTRILPRPKEIAVTNSLDRIRRHALSSFIALLSLSALFAIIAVVNGDFGEFQVKVLATASIIAAASVGSLACAAFVSKGGTREVGMTGIGMSIFAASVVIIGIWGEIGNSGFWKFTAIANVFAAASSHALALWVMRLPEDHRWTQRAASATDGFLAMLISIGILNDFRGTGMFKLIAVVAIVAALWTLVIPILSRMRPGKQTLAPQSESRATLVLTEQADGEYVDGEGNRYEVRRVE